MSGRRSKAIRQQLALAGYDWREKTWDVEPGAYNQKHAIAPRMSIECGAARYRRMKRGYATLTSEDIKRHHGKAGAA